MPHPRNIRTRDISRVRLMNGSRSFLMLLLAGLLAVGCLPGRASAQVSDDQALDSIAKLKKYLYSVQDPATGSWEKNATYDVKMYEGGYTALATYALITAGESPQRPELEKAIDYLRKLKPKATYVTSLRAHVWSHTPDEYLPLLEQDAQQLEEWAKPDGLWGYPARGPDLSNSQYGILGLWEASKRGVLLRTEYMDNSMKTWLTIQNEDGGWAYGKNGNSTPSMTCAGLTAVYIGQQLLHRKSSTPDKDFAKSIDKGIGWLNKNFDAKAGNRWYYYYLYCVERVGLASGYKDFNGKDWYATGAQAVVERMKKTGSLDKVDDSAFALAFLARGGVPVWVTKLEIPGSNWNNRPNDMYFLTAALSDYRQQELNWQVVSIDRPVEELLSSPILYLSLSQPMNLTPEQKQKLKTYLDLGGILWVNPEGGASGVTASVRTTLEAMYPGRKMDALKPDNPVYHSLIPMQGGASSLILGLNNGVRNLVVMPTTDWGMIYQSAGFNEAHVAWQFAINLFVQCTERGAPGALERRLVPRVEVRQKRDAAGSLVYGRLSYDGEWLPEPGAWRPLATHLFNKSGLKLYPTGLGDSPLAKEAPEEAKAVLTAADLEKTPIKFVHVSGIRSAQLKPEEIKALAAYAKRGGTVLVETVGGIGDFASAIEEQLGTEMNLSAVPVYARSDDPMLTGEGLSGGADIRAVHYRRFTVFGASTISRRPKLTAFFIDERPAILFSTLDLTEGVLGVHHWNISGYHTDSARDIMTNLMLAAHKRELK